MGRCMCLFWELKDACCVQEGGFMEVLQLLILRGQGSLLLRMKGVVGKVVRTDSDGSKILGFSDL